MKKLAGLIVLCGIGFLVKGQVAMTPLVAGVGIVQKPQLWSVLVVNTSSSPIECKLSLVVSDQSTNQPILTGESNRFIVQSGTTQLTSSDFEPILYNYPSSIYSDQDPSGFLPVGIYQACYTLSKEVSDYYVTVSEECITITIEPLSPPMLSMPEDQSEIATTALQFTWLPPQPLAIFNTITYDLLVAEILSGQTANDAIQLNIPAYTATNLSEIYNNYNSAFATLDSTKQYAWQIIAKNNNQYAAQSEIWSFSFHHDTAADITMADGKPFIKLKQDMDAYLSLFETSIRCYYNNEANDSIVNYNVTSLGEEDLGAIILSGVLGLSFGDNFLEIPLSQNAGFLNNNNYLMQITNSRNEQWNIKFRYKANIE